jgi:alpha-glucosidase (family GH31 glycosyl hydrolase)
LNQCYGHDIGGFEGPQPSPELLVRWVQLGIYSSRFAINCFKTTPENNNVGDVIEPWMYPETTSIVRKALRRRYEMIPYVYSLALESHMTASPPQRWTGWGYESDPEVWKSQLLKDGETQYWLGDSLLIGGVYEPGSAVARMYLPGAGEDTLYLNMNKPQQYVTAGQWIDVESKWDESIPVFAKVGGALPVGLPEQTLSPGEVENPASLPADDYRAVELFPGPGNECPRSYSNCWYEDDGISPAPATVSSFTIAYSWNSSDVEVTYKESFQGNLVPAWEKLHIILPPGDSRQVSLNGQKMTHVSADDEGRQKYVSSGLRDRSAKL